MEDSWPRTYICLGWNVEETGVEVVLSVSDKHLDYDGLVRKELNALLMKVNNILQFVSNHLTDISGQDEVLQRHKSLRCCSHL